MANHKRRINVFSLYERVIFWASLFGSFRYTLACDALAIANNCICTGEKYQTIKVHAILSKTQISGNTKHIQRFHLYCCTFHRTNWLGCITISHCTHINMSTIYQHFIEECWWDEKPICFDCPNVPTVPKKILQYFDSIQEFFIFRRHIFNSQHQQCIILIWIQHLDTYL